MESLKSLGILFSILIALVAGVLTVAGGGDGLWEHEGLIQIRAPRSRVFQLLSDPEMRKEWVPNLVDSKAEPSGWLKQGSRLFEVVEVDGERHERILEITEFKEGSVFAYRTTEEGVEVELRYEVSDFLSGKRSQIKYTCRAQFPGRVAVVIEPILGHRRLSRMKVSFGRLTALTTIEN